MPSDTSTLSFDARRLSFNLDADFQTALRKVWTIAEPIVDEMAREFWKRVLSRPEVASCYDDLSEKQRLKGFREYTRRKMTSAIDQDWIDFVSLQGVGAAERKIEVHVPLGAFAATYSLLSRRVEDAAPAQPLRLIQALSTLQALEAEVITSQINAYHRSAAADQRRHYVEQFEADIGKTVSELASASEQLSTETRVLLEAGSRLVENTQHLATASSQTTLAMEGAARSSSDLVSAIERIRTITQASSSLINATLDDGKMATASATELASHANSIQSIVKLIREVSEQTKILALNATIEATRAGEAGRAFAVVAGEVKALASQTEEATRRISKDVLDIGEISADVVEKTSATENRLQQIQKGSIENLQLTDDQGNTASIISSSIDETAIVARSSADALVSVKTDAEDMIERLAAANDTIQETNDKLSKLRQNVSAFIGALQGADRMG